MPKRLKKEVRAKVASTSNRRTTQSFNQEAEEILRKAATYCVLTFPTLWTVGGIKELKTKNGSRQWIIAVYLRYPTGHEGYLGDLLFDGEQFRQLTDRDVMRERARQIEADPALKREWNEYRASTISARKA